MAYGVGVNEYPRQIKPNLVRWVIPGWSFQANASVAIINGVISYTPILVAERTSYDRVSVKVLTLQAATTLDLRLFAWESGVPGALIEDFGNVSLAAVAIVEIVIARTLGPGYYFLARRSAAGGGAALSGISSSSTSGCPVSASETVPGLILRPIMTVTAGWADPAPAPTSTLGLTEAAIYLREV